MQRLLVQRRLASAISALSSHSSSRPTYTGNTAETTCTRLSREDIAIMGCNASKAFVRRRICPCSSACGLPKLTLLLLPSFLSPCLPLQRCVFANTDNNRSRVKFATRILRYLVVNLCPIQTQQKQGPGIVTGDSFVGWLFGLPPADASTHDTGYGSSSAGSQNLIVEKSTSARPGTSGSQLPRPCDLTSALLRQEHYPGNGEVYQPGRAL